MKTTTPISEPLNILLIGNNPMELGSILDKIHQVKSQKINTEIAFDLRTILERLMRFDANFIFIDDNIGKFELQQIIKQFSSSSKTKDIPITVLKSSNYQEAYGASSVVDYLLKQNLSVDALYNTVKNSLKFRKTQDYLEALYQERKMLLLNLTH